MTLDEGVIEKLLRPMAETWRFWLFWDTLQSNGAYCSIKIQSCLFWLDKMADLGYTEAKFHLASMFSNGEGLDTNYLRSADFDKEMSGQGYIE